MSNVITRNTNKWKQHVRQPNRARIYANRPDAFYKHSDGSFTRAVRTSSFRAYCTMMRRCDEQGQIIPRVRMSKKLKLRIRRLKAADAAAS